ncbi:AfsR/SARP family transcriptional regulator [Kibdelosporangium aridum]|uniref:DNA-binding transcriptional activator of the SARP family n=1 Tax=Kibdelosporangium aridum TaxID=2030 RepID=A0A1W2EAZ4_KIBAR|nr:BTAD domain-containing putative transcriptional regulator [Kibdelosporangium aridum]SMD06923.1 DNA-binding transcriptional activator of the SARP family [Kibdelosporangium aridum]
MTKGFKFRVLGPLVAGDAELGGTKPRVLLATLLLNANQTVTYDMLTDALWPNRRPRSVAANLRTYVSSLRASSPEISARMRTDRLGYSITIGQGELDLAEFTEHVAKARQFRAAGALAEAAGQLENALALWRGDPLADLPGVHAWGDRLAALAEARVVATEELLGLRVAEGRYQDAIAELRPFLAEHPFRESGWQQLLLALNGSGQQAEALRTYAEIRKRLVTELGVEPGPELRKVHAAILKGEAPQQEPAMVRAVPRQLPQDVPDFTGRGKHIAAMRAIFTSGDDSASVATIVGSPGVGKTSLAVHVAHLLKEEFPDGQLYVDLAGTTNRPRTDKEVLGSLLRSLGVTGAALPDTAHDRATLYRSLASETRMLVLFDDAANAAQVQGLLPASNWGVLVTSRQRMAELPATHQIELDVLPTSEAGELLGKIAGLDRVNREPEAAEAILQSCGYLPLAIRIAGARIAGRRGWTLNVLERRLADETQRLSELKAGELAVRASFDLSYRQLPADAAAAFRLLGRLGPSTIPEWAAGALLDRQDSADLVDVLVDANMLEIAGMDAIDQPRYLMHDLIRVYARDAAETDARQSVSRVVSGWLGLVETALAQMPVSIFRPLPWDGPRHQVGKSIVDAVAAAPLHWLDAEHETLISVVELAANEGLDALACTLATTLVPYFDHRCHFDSWQRVHETALKSAKDTLSQAALLRGIAQVHLYRDSYSVAEATYAKSRSLFIEAGDALGEGFASCGVGAARYFRGRPLAALPYFHKGLNIFVDQGDVHAEAYARQAIGKAQMAIGNHAEAANWLERALMLSREAGDRHREGRVLSELGRLHGTAGYTKKAVRYLEMSLEILRDLGDDLCSAYALHWLADLHTTSGDFGRAEVEVRQALAAFRRLKDRSGEEKAEWTLNVLRRRRGARLEQITG